MKIPKISVCIVTFNHDEYINDCLASVIGQQVEADIEILVGDDYSTDQTREIINEYAERYPTLINPIFHEKNIGGSENHRFLINRASGDYIAHLDGDDFWLPGKLAAQLQFLKKNPNCVAAYTNAIVISNSGELIARFNGVLPKQFDLDYLVSKGNFLNASSLMYRASCKESILQLQGNVLDYQYSISLATQGFLGYVNRTLVIYRKNSTTSIISTNLELVHELYWKAIMYAWAMGAEKRALRQCISLFYRNILGTSLAYGQSQRAWFWSKKILKECSLISSRFLIQAATILPFDITKYILRKLRRYIFKRGVEILYDR